MATHSPEVVPFADRVFEIHDGKLVVSGRPAGDAPHQRQPRSERAVASYP
jgi:hypothetical protein